MNSAAVCHHFFPPATPSKTTMSNCAACHRFFPLAKQKKRTTLVPLSFSSQQRGGGRKKRRRRELTFKLPL